MVIIIVEVVIIYNDLNGIIKHKLAVMKATGECVTPLNLRFMTFF